MSTQNGAGTSPSELVTLIITTSPTPSAPSTDLISDILASFKLHCEALLSCRVIVVFDTYDRIGESMRLKKGQITAEGARAVEQYKTNVKDLILNEWYPKAAEAAHVSCMAKLGRVRVAASCREPCCAVDLADARQARHIHRACRPCWLRPRGALGPQNDRDPLRLGPAARLAAGARHPARVPGESDASLRRRHHRAREIRLPPRDPDAIVRDVGARATIPHTTRPDSEAQARLSHLRRARVPLTPLFFWHDKPHVASTAHYLARVFPSRLAIARGDFIEDSVGQRARTQMKDGNWTKWLAGSITPPTAGKSACSIAMVGSGGASRLTCRRRPCLPR